MQDLLYRLSDYQDWFVVAFAALCLVGGIVWVEAQRKQKRSR